MKKLQFSKALCQYYDKWYRDSYDSMIYCLDKNQPEKAAEYRIFHREMFDLINEYWDAIEFFRIGNNAFYLPEYTKKLWLEYCKYNNFNPNDFPGKEEFINQWAEE